METPQVTVIDASGLILGRMSSIIAKRLLQGENIVIINAEKAVISGKRKPVIRERKEFLEVGHPWKGPYHYRRPDRIVRRTVECCLITSPKGNKPIKGLEFTSESQKNLRTNLMRQFQRQVQKS